MHAQESVARPVHRKSWKESKDKRYGHNARFRKFLFGTISRSLSFTTPVLRSNEIQGKKKKIWDLSQLERLAPSSNRYDQPRVPFIVHHAYVRQVLTECEISNCFHLFERSDSSIVVNPVSYPDVASALQRGAPITQIVPVRIMRASKCLASHTGLILSRDSYNHGQALPLCHAPPPDNISHSFRFTMLETQRLLQAAGALSQALGSRSIPHAFHGNVLIAVLANVPRSDEIFCIVEGRQYHPFRHVREALAGSEQLTVAHSPWTDRLHVSYNHLTPAVEIEILPAGEGGPRRLDTSTVMRMHGVPFLTVSEFIRAKVKIWAIRGEDRDAQDIHYALTRYWNRVDINRVPDQDMTNFVARYPATKPVWLAIKARYDA